MDPKGVVPSVLFVHSEEGGWDRIPGQVPREMGLTVFVNRRELVTILCTPTKLNCLVIGFLYAEGIIRDIKDVANMRICEEDSLADVTLCDSEYEPPKQRTLTSGCGGGTTFKTQGQGVDSDLVTTPEAVSSQMKRLQGRMDLYRIAGGVHTSALADDESLLVVSEDIGRHNTLDKIQGESLLRGISTKDRMLMSTGRISSEMLLKAAKMKVPVVVSRHSPTGSAVSLARDLGISLIGHARGNRLSVYSHPERRGCPLAEE